MATFDDLLEEAGPFGRCQKRVFGLFCLLSCSFAGMYVGIVFQGFTPGHWCRDPAVMDKRTSCGWSLEDVRGLTAPPANGSGSCEQLEVDWNSTGLSCDTQNLELSGFPVVACKVRARPSRPRARYHSDGRLPCHVLEPIRKKPRTEREQMVCDSVVCFSGRLDVRLRRQEVLRHRGERSSEAPDGRTCGSVCDVCPCRLSLTWSAPTPGWWICTSPPSVWGTSSAASRSATSPTGEDCCCSLVVV